MSQAGSSAAHRFLLDQQLDGADRVRRLGLQAIDEALVAFPLPSLRVAHPFPAAMVHEVEGGRRRRTWWQSVSNHAKASVVGCEIMERKKGESVEMMDGWRCD